MPTLVTDPELEKQLQASREASGADRFDEVWEGTTMMSPMPNDEHQDLVGLLTSILIEVIRWPGLGEVRPGVNVSDRREDWKGNYRVPDVAVFLKNGSAENLGTHWLGGPDFAVEIISPDDRTREKISFYESVGVGELLIIDRDPWQIELLRNVGGQLTEVGRALPDTGSSITSENVNLGFKLLHGDPRPQIEVRSDRADRTWVL